MDKNKLVTICIPTFNRPKMLKKALESAIGQTYENLEILVSDNCSTNPDVEPLCREYKVKDSRVRYFRQEKNIGIYKNAAFLTNKVCGKFMFHLCDDDWISENFVEKCVNAFLTDEKCAAVYGATQLFGIENKPQNLLCSPSIDSDNYAARVAAFILTAHYYRTATAMFKTENINHLNGSIFARGRFCEDLIFIVKMLYFGKLKIIPEICYHKFNDGLTNDIDKLKILFNIPELTDGYGFVEACAKEVSKAFFEDDFFISNLTVKERVDVVANLFQEFLKAKMTADPSIISSMCIFPSLHLHHNVCTHKNIWRYLWRKPLALFDRKYTIIFEPRGTK